jgi:DNA (cytosine-5)-methyltransferase 1
LLANGKAAGSATNQDADQGLLVATTLRSRDLAKSVDSDCTDTLIAHALRGEGFDASEDGTGRGTPLVPVAFALRGREGGAMPEVGGDQVGSLRAASGGSSRDYVAFDTTQITSAANYSNPQPGDPCHPLASGAHPPAVAFAHQAGGVQTTLGYDPASGTSPTLSAHQTPAIAGSCVRRLTPRECERLQGFPDDYTLIEVRGKPAADGPRYKALGNSMAVPVMAWIGQRIAAVDAIPVAANEAAA